MNKKLPPPLLGPGLDSTAAAEVMEAVARLAAGGVTAVATIHSPTARAYELLDRVLMLLDGRVLYFGQTGGSPGAAAGRRC